MGRAWVSVVIVDYLSLSLSLSLSTLSISVSLVFFLFTFFFGNGGVKVGGVGRALVSVFVVEGRVEELLCHFLLFICIISAYSFGF